MTMNMTSLLLFYPMGIIGIPQLFLLPIVIVIICVIVNSVKKQKRERHSQDYKQPSVSDIKENDSFKVTEDGTIIRISGIQTCLQCKAPITANAKYCPECGVKLQ